MNLLRRISRLARTLAWYAGTTKEHSRSGLRIPRRGFVAEDVSVVYPERVHIGPGVLVLPGAALICSGLPPYVIAEGSISIGEGSIIREGAILQTYGGSITVGQNCTVNAYSVFQGNGGISIGNNVLIAAHVCIFSANHVFVDPTRRIRDQGETCKGVRIDDDVWIGAGAKILDGVRIGNGAVVAAGAVVNRDIPPFEIFGGVPARKIGSRDPS